MAERKVMFDAGKKFKVEILLSDNSSDTFVLTGDLVELLRSEVWIKGYVRKRDKVFFLVSPYIICDIKITHYEQTTKKD